MARRAKGGAAKKKNKSNNDVPDVYVEMLNEHLGGGSSSAPATPSPKRRKVAGVALRAKVREEEEARLGKGKEKDAPVDAPVTVKGKGKEPEERQKVTESGPDYLADGNFYVSDDEGEDEDEDEDEMDWEDVDLSKQMPSVQAIAAGGDVQFTLDIGHRAKISKGNIRKITAVERKLRLEIHKLHLLSLLAHVELRNSWCDEDDVKEALRPLLAKRVHSYLHPPADAGQKEQSRLFMEGLALSAKIWKNRFKQTRRGLAAPLWQESASERAQLVKRIMEDHYDPSLTYEKFLEAAKSLDGSRDLGAQLFCAFLRSAGVLARLVCSLQPLPFHFASKGTLKFNLLPADQKENADGTKCIATVADSEKPARFEPRAVSTLPKQSDFPIYWVEAWNKYSQKWISVDPVITHTINAPDKLEPPYSDPQNTLSYVVAFEPDHSARDVTRRYAKAYNAKTRKFRVGNTKGGEKWWRGVMRYYEREDGDVKDRDQLEDAELNEREVNEGIPKAVADIKGHPVFALKRHLGRYEVLWPEKKVGSITSGSGKAKVTEDVFRRKDVKPVKTPEQWYRLGRILKVGEQPVKMVPARKKTGFTAKRKRKAESEGEDSEEEDTNMMEYQGNASQVGLYGIWQTEVYVPPPVLDGFIPKNAYGNLDVFVPTMVPQGGTHIQHPLARKACASLGVDFAEAVVGFNFLPRQVPTPIINGVVVASEFVEAIEGIIMQLEEEEKKKEREIRSMEAQVLWKRFLTKLKIRQRVEGYDIEGTASEEREGGNTEEGQGEEETVEAGGFLREHQHSGFPAQEAQQDMPESNEKMYTIYLGGSFSEGLRSVRSPRRSKGASDDVEMTGALPSGFLHGDSTSGTVCPGGFLPDDDNTKNVRPGGFTSEDIAKDISEDDAAPGGFIPEDVIPEPQEHAVKGKEKVVDTPNTEQEDVDMERQSEQDDEEDPGALLNESDVEDDWF